MAAAFRDTAEQQRKEPGATEGVPRGNEGRREEPYGRKSKTRQFFNQHSLRRTSGPGGLTSRLYPAGWTANVWGRAVYRT